MTRTKIKNEYGIIIGYIEEDDKVKIAKDFYGKILGKYHKDLDKTMNFRGYIVGKGDLTSALIWESQRKQ